MQIVQIVGATVGPVSLLSLKSWIFCRQNYHPGNLVSCVLFPRWLPPWWLALKKSLELGVTFTLG